MKKRIIIAEVAQGYGGDFNLAKLFIAAAKSSLADAIKFQLVIADELATKNYLHYSLFKSLEMSLSNWYNLKCYSEAIGIELIIDIFGSKSLQTAEKLQLHSIKLHPTDLTNTTLIKKIIKSPINNVFLGIGGSNLPAVESAVKLLRLKNICIMAGFQGYPTSFADNELYRINMLQAKFSSMKNITVGFADHESGNSGLSAKEISAVAIGNGAEILEKHLTISSIMKLEDYESALNPDQFLDYSTSMRKCWKAQSNSKRNFHNYRLTKKELQYSQDIKRILVADKNIKKGHKLTIQNTVLKRSGDPGDIFSIESVLGKQTKKEISKDTPIRTEDLRK